MEDVSNNTIGFLLVISILVTIVMIFIGPGGLTITGAATNESFGAANITLQTVTQITLKNNSVDFGVGFVNSSANNCTLVSNSATKTEACQGFNAPAKDGWFGIENNGNTNVTLQINGTYANPRGFLCNATNPIQNCTFSTAEYKWQSGDVESGSCGGAGSSGDLNTTLQTVCTNFKFNSNSNEVAVIILITVPRDSKQGHLRDNVTFLATSS